MASMDFLQALALLERFEIEGDGETSNDLDPCHQSAAVNMFRRGSLDVPEISQCFEGKHKKKIDVGRRPVVHWADETFDSLETTSGFVNKTISTREVTLSENKKPKSILKKRKP